MPAITAYHRPTTVAEALRLLARPGMNTAAIAGGTFFVPRRNEGVDEVVDLQALSLDGVEYGPDRLTLGAMVRLQTLVNDDRAPALLRDAARREGPNTFCHAGTVGGAIVAAGWESEFLAALLVFEADVEIQTPGGSRALPLPDVLAGAPAALNGGLLAAVSLRTGGRTAAERVARTPADKPIVAAVGRLDGAGRLRLALCGVAETPVLVDPARLDSLAPPADFRGSAEYRREMAAALAKRVATVLGKAKT